MENRLDHLFQEWHRLGGAVLLDEIDPAVQVRKAEEILAESTNHCRYSGRLTWIVLDWLILHVDAIDESELLKNTQKYGDPSVLGVLCDAARQHTPHPKLDRIVRGCSPYYQLEPFFYRVGKSPLATRMAHENALDVFTRWNYVSNELRYLTTPSHNLNLS